MHASDVERALAQTRIADHLRTNSIESPGQLVVVYFTPKDRKPAFDYVNRIRRIVNECATFFENGLATHGFPNRLTNILRTSNEQIEVIDVIGAGRDQDYSKSDGQRIRNEALPVLRERGIDPNRSVLLIFCNLMDYDPIKQTISHHSPYYGGGSHVAGTAWQCDSEILDPRRMHDQTPLTDREYGKITIGRHNSIFVGGVIHELGHALSLPHCREREDERVRGTSLMGAGNRTYGEQLRGEGRGTFLTEASALRLAAHPVFNARVPPQLMARKNIKWCDLKVKIVDQDQLGILGRIESTIPVHGVIAYFDPNGGGDYDATTSTAIPDDAGRFSLASESLQKNKGYELRLVACYINGATSSRRGMFEVDSSGHPKLDAIRLELELSSMMEALSKSDIALAEVELEHLAANDVELLAIGDRVINRFKDVTKAKPIDLSTVPNRDKTLELSKVQPSQAEVGWMQPTYDRVPEEGRLLSLGGDYFASGIYAHAPAKHTYPLAGRWKRLTGRCGIQGNHPGKVDFVIVGDARVLWSARAIESGLGAPFEVNVEGVQTLILQVTDGGDGNSGDWGVWIEPVIRR